MVSKCFANSKKSKSIETHGIVSLLREVEEVSITMLDSIFSSICPAKETSNKWSMVFKSSESKRVHCEGDKEENINQVQNMYSSLKALNKKSSKTNEILGTQEVQKCLKTYDINMQECEDKLDYLVRSLIKARVSILNVINH
ncbi:hypothetical protein POM88_010222 [Heracleum sosnowskyi]|uniref:Uncharacterized protein n=1 Tax=Heracleum sosnowskyi TaxID=360622 RepID=A0AAD8JAB2_9APIA|nr:hypothetical protein POM88_010222 [Heracleum sosnowskyi]